MNERTIPDHPDYTITSSGHVYSHKWGRRHEILCSQGRVCLDGKFKIVKNLVASLFGEQRKTGERSIPGYADYTVTRQGEIFSYKWNKRRRLEPTISASGYRTVECDSVSQPVGRWVLLAFVGSCPAECEMLHKNGNRLDDRLKNLRWGSRQENINDRQRHGTQCQGVEHPRARLTAAQVRVLREAYRSKTRTIADLAREYGVGYYTASNAARGRSYKDVK